MKLVQAYALRRVDEARRDVLAAVKECKEYILESKVGGRFLLC